MDSLGRLALLAVTLCVAASAADAQAVRLSRPPPTAKDNDVLPRIAAPATPATAKINAALDRLDARWRKALADCRAEGGADASASRHVETAMAGPKVLSLLVSDDSFCGGAHPDVSQMALAYDLDAGRPLDWTRLLPKAIVQSASLDQADDGSTLGVIVSPTLDRLYLAAAEAQSGKDADWRSDCRGVLADPGLAFQLWPDAKADAVMLLPDGLPFAVAACADPVPVPTAALRALGADEGLLDAIDDAHRGG